MDSWKAIKSLYLEKLDIPEDIVEKLSSELILKKCAMGLSNLRISKQLDLDMPFIIDTLLTYFNFSGWKFDLDFSPLAIYNRCDGDFNCFEQEVKTISPFDFDRDIKLAFFICSVYNNIREEISKFYG